MSDRTAQTASSGPETIQEQASNLRARVSSAVGSIAEDQKNRAAEGVHGAAEATREAARRLRGNNHGWMAGIADSTADVLNDLSDTLRQSDYHSLFARVEGFAREQPVMFAAGAFAAGLLFARATRLGTETGSDASTTATTCAGPTSYTEAGREC